MMSRTGRAAAGGGERLSTLLARLSHHGLLVSSPAQDPLLTGISDDSRRVQPGWLFCAWCGTTADSHVYLPAAEQAGAAAVLVERPVPDSALPQIVVTDGRRAAAVAAMLLYGDPADRLVLVGVTGTNGKTTTVWLLRHLLATQYEVASIGTLGVLTSGQALSGDPLTTPGPVALARTLRQLVDRGVTAVAMEVSSHALDQGRVHGIRFDVAVFTNLTRDHLDYHRTEAAYLAAKRELAKLVRPSGTLAINLDDPAWAGLAAGAPRALQFSVSSAEADVRAADLTLSARGARFRLVTPSGDVPTQLPLLGDFNVQNSLAAATACLALGLEPAAIASALRTTPQVPGRLERIADVPCPVLTDYAHTPDALERVLSAVKPLVAGRLIVVFGAGGDRDRGKRPLMGEVAERLADVAIVTSDNPRTEEPDSIIDDIVAGMHAGRFVRVMDRRSAIGRALALASAEDVIVLAGKGHETYQILGTETVPFDERQVVAELGRPSANEVRL